VVLITPDGGAPRLRKQHQENQAEGDDGS
jgi:hypothetical protein